MQTFQYAKADTVDKALAQASAGRFIAGGTTLVDLMKLDVERPGTLVDINAVPLAKIEALPAGGLRIGALVRMCRNPTQCSRRRCFQAPRHSCAIWQPPAATCCSVRAAPTSASPPRARRAATAATSALPARDARRSTATTGRTRFSAPANTASRPTPQTCASPWPHWKR
jgi:hypothetical protein